MVGGLEAKTVGGATSRMSARISLNVVLPDSYPKKIGMPNHPPVVGVLQVTQVL
jgi:hypothetical protein